MIEIFDRLFSKNAKTSISGLLAAAGMAGMTVPGVPEKYKWIFAVLATVGTAGLGLSAKDATTHSDITEVEQATKEKEVKEEKK